MNTAYEQLPLSARADIETAFITLGGVPAAFGTSALSLPGRTASSPQQRLAALQSKVITEVALPHVCRIMNLCLTEVALLHVCRDFGTPTGSSSSAGGGGGDLAPSSSVKQSKQSGASLPPQQQGDAAAAAGGPVVLPPTEFTFPAMIQLYNALAPLQPAFTEQYLQFFNLLDVHDEGTITQADLKHCMCAAGDRLSEEEFRHLLFSVDLLHKERLTVYEFLRILMKIGVDGRPT